MTASTNGSLCVVVPCYNEAARLNPDAFVEFVQEHGNTRFVFVDDGSTDSTRTILRASVGRIPNNAGLVELAENKGKGEAVRLGILDAINGGAQRVGYWDADLATPLNAVADLAEDLERHPEAVMVMGARVQLLGRHIERRPVRHYLGRVFATLASVTVRLPCYDTQCGAKLFRVCPAVVGAFQDPFVSRWIFDVEIMVRLTVKEGLDGRTAIREFPLTAWEDVSGSKVGPSDCWMALRDLARINWAYFGPGSNPSRFGRH